MSANSRQTVGIVEWAKKTPPDSSDGELLLVDQNNSKISLRTTGPESSNIAEYKLAKRP